MTLFSKLRAVPFSPKSVLVTPKRGIRFPNHGLPTNPNPDIDAFCDEPHGKHLGPLFNVMCFIIIPALSAYCWYHEYQEKFVHKERIPFPKQDFLHQGTNPFKFGDGKHTLMHHPFFNFTADGYETDKNGNPLPPGEYAME